MVEKTWLREKGQVSLEILLLSTVVIILCLTVFGYYTQIRDSTIAMEVLKVEALRQIDREEGLFVVEKIEYKIDAGTANFCVLLSPAVDVLNTGTIATLIEGNTGFAAGSVTVSQNSLASCQ